MRHLGRPVRIGVKVIAGEVGAIATKLNILLVNASKDIARFGHAKKGDCPLFIPTTFTGGLFNGNAHPF